MIPGQWERVLHLTAWVVSDLPLPQPQREAVSSGYLEFSLKPRESRTKLKSSFCINSGCEQVRGTRGTTDGSSRRGDEGAAAVLSGRITHTGVAQAWWVT